MAKAKSEGSTTSENNILQSSKNARNQKSLKNRGSYYMAAIR